MIKYNGSVYFVTVNDVDYVVKNNHLDEFVALMINNGAIIITSFGMSDLYFDHALQWYKTL